jgi:hypothetical protein
MITQVCGTGNVWTCLDVYSVQVKYVNEDPHDVVLGSVTVNEGAHGPILIGGTGWADGLHGVGSRSSVVSGTWYTYTGHWAGKYIAWNPPSYTHGGNTTLHWTYRGKAESTSYYYNILSV